MLATYHQTAAGMDAERKCPRKVVSREQCQEENTASEYRCKRRAVNEKRRRAVKLLQCFFSADTACGTCIRTLWSTAVTAHVGSEMKQSKLGIMNVMDWESR